MGKDVLKSMFKAKRFLSVLLCFVIGFSLCACSDFPASEADLNDEQVPSKYRSQMYENKQAGKDTLNLWYDMNLIMAVHYPTFENSLDTYIVNKVNEIRGAFVNEAQGFKATRFAKRGTLYTDCEVLKSGDLISVIMHIFSYDIETTLNGGIETFVYDTKRDALITDDAYFSSDYVSFVNQTAKTEIPAALSSQGVSGYTFSDFPKFSKFSVKSSGVTFWFSASEFTGASEPVSFEISADKIKDHVFYGKIDPNKPMVAITYDDGPGAGTSKVLDVMEKYGVRCTFFQVGECLGDGQADLLKRAIKLGCQLGAHSENHDDLSKMSASAALKDVQGVAKTISDLTGGYNVKICRPPYGAYTKAMVEEFESNGIALVNWSVDTLDWKYRDSAWVVSQVQNVSDGDIILMHDIHATTVNACEDVVKSLLAQGFQLVTVSEMMTARGVKNNGKIILDCYKN